MKFFNLLKKEIRELITLQVILEMVMVVVIFLLFGQVFSGVMETAFSSANITVCDRDRTEYTAALFKALEEDGHNVEYVELQGDDYSEEMSRLDIKHLLVIPAGFTEAVNSGKEATVEAVSVMNSISMYSNMSSELEDAVDLIETEVKKTILMQQHGMSEEEMDIADSPIKVSELTVVDGKTAEIPIDVISSFSMGQGMIVPLAVFVLVIFAGQMIISAISTEKIDKTLETLLSAPVSRVSVLSAKMLAAAIVALLNAVVYMIAMVMMMNGMTSGMVSGATNGAQASLGELGESAGIALTMVELGLVMTPADYLLLGLQMFVTIMIALAISMMLGVFANDQKSAQTMLLPIMFLTMMPFLVTMFTSISELPGVIKWIMYAIPFTHTFSATENLIFGHMGAYWAGLGYQVLFFILCMFLAVKLFSSDKLFTMSFNFAKKKKAEE